MTNMREGAVRGRILVIDDELAISKFMASELRRDGYEAVIANDGLQGVELARQDFFEAAVTDLTMPGIDGLETLRRLRAVDPELQVIMSTGYGTIDSAVESMRLGAFDFLQKPFKMSQLLSTLDRALETRRLKVANSLFKVTQTLLARREPKEVARAAVEIAAARFAARAAVLVFTTPGQEQPQEEHWYQSEPALEPTLTIARQAIGQATEPRLVMSSDDKDAWIVHPVVHCDTWLGVLVLCRPASRGAMSPSEVEWAALVVSQLALALENAGLVERLKREIAERCSSEEAALEASRVKSRFLANMSHEIRTPLNGVLGMATLALDTAVTPEQREYLETMRGSADSLLAIINDILDISKIESGKLEIERVDLDLHAVLAETLQPLAIAAQSKGLELMCSVEADVAPHRVGDPLRLRQVLVNLVGNAIKFTERGEIAVHVRRAERMRPSTIEVSVADTGIGVTSDAAARIFEAFTQGDESSTRRFGGTGLGLAISKQLVGLMRGRIWMETDPGSGSIFRFTAELPEAPASSRASAAAGLEGCRVLLVDPNPKRRGSMRRTLEGAGAAAEEAADEAGAIDALAEAARKGAPIDVALIDLDRSNEHGLSIGARIKSERRFGSTALVLLVPPGLMLAAPRWTSAGFVGSAVKPIFGSALFAAIRAARRWGEAKAVEAVTARPEPAQLATTRDVLLVEDNAVNRIIAARLLETLGHRVVVADNGRAAVELVARLSFDLVLMDLQMPEMDGFEATRAIRRAERFTGRHVPIVALTAHAMRGDEARCLECGMDGHLTKPINLKQLGEHLSRLFPEGPRDVATPASVSTLTTRSVVA